MQLSPRVRAILERLGVNTTRLQWKLYQRERRMQEQTTQSRLPVGLRWLEYQHKFCPHCNAVVPRDERVCHKCGRRVPSMGVYRVRRILGLMSSNTAAPTVYLFLVVMLIVYLLQVMLQGPAAIINPSRLTLVVFGAWNPLFILYKHEYWRMISFGLVHAGALHILFNGIALTQVGPTIEEEAGYKRMLVLITFTQITAALATHYWYVQVGQSLAAVTVGASGWLFGLLGYGIGHFHRSGERMRRDFFVQWAVYGILFGFLLGANNAAHVGGMLGGILMGALPRPRRFHDDKDSFLWTGAFWASAGLWLVTLGFMAHFIIQNWTTSAAVQ
jgi:rhomboid protease GluP